MNPQNGWANAINSMVSCISFSDKLVALVPNLYNYCMWLMSASDGLTPKLFGELTMRVCRWPKAHYYHVWRRCGVESMTENPLYRSLQMFVCIENTNVVYNLTLCDDIIIVSLWCSLFIYTRHLNNVNNTVSLTLIHLHRITLNFEFFKENCFCLFCAEIYCKVINCQQSHIGRTNSSTKMMRKQNKNWKIKYVYLFCRSHVHSVSSLLFRVSLCGHKPL